MSTKDWIHTETLGDWMRAQEKRTMHEERRPHIHSAQDLMGPALGPRALIVSDWNSEEATSFNGFLYGAAGAANSPDATKAWFGIAVSTGNHTEQMLWSHGHNTTTFGYTRSVHQHSTSAQDFDDWQASSDVAPTSMALDDLTDVNAPAPTSGQYLSYDSVAGEWVPHAFAHTHVKADITDFSHTHTKSQITDFAHTHPLDDLTAGTLAPPLTMAEQATPATPASGTSVMWVGTDHRPYIKKPDGTVTDLTSVPTAVSDGIAPSGSITLTHIGGIGSLFYRWTAATSADPVKYKLFVRAGSAPTTSDDTYLVASGLGITSAAVRNLADGTAIVVDGSVTYYGIVTSSDLDGAGPTSNTATGIPAQVTTADIATNAITTDLMIANDAFIDALNAIDFSAVTITGPTIQTNADPTQGIHLDSTGLRAYGPAGGSPFLNVDPAAGMAIVAGLIKTFSLTVTPATGDKTSLGGITEIATGGVLKLTGGTTAPASAPSLDTGYDSAQFTNDGNWGNRAGWTTDGTYWYTTRLDGSKMWLEKWNADGTLNTGVNIRLGIGALGGVVYGGGSLWTLSKNSAGTWDVNQCSTALTSLASWAWTDADGTRIPRITYDPSPIPSAEIVIVQSAASRDQLGIYRYSTTGTPRSVVYGTFTFTGDLAAILYGSFDIGTNRYIFANNGPGIFRSMITSGAEQTGESWSSGMTGKVGGAWTGTAFVSIDQTGLMRTYTGITSTTTSDMTKWVSNTLARGSTPTYETDQSPRASITMPKRSKLLVTTTAIVDDGSATPPDRVRIYVGKGSTDPGRTQMALQTSPAAGVTATSYSSLAAPPGTNPPASPNFPAGTGTSLVDKSGNVLINSDGDHVNGTVGTGAFRDSVRGSVGNWTSYTPALTASTTNPGVSSAIGRYKTNGQTLWIRYRFVLSTIGSGVYSISLPPGITSAMVDDQAAQAVGYGEFQDVSAGQDAQRLGRLIFYAAAGTLQMSTPSTGERMASTATPVPASGDVISGTAELLLV